MSSSLENGAQANKYGISITFQSRTVLVLLFLGLATNSEVWYLYDKYQASGCTLTNETADTCKAKEKLQVQFNTQHILQILHTHFDALVLIS